MSVNSHRRRHAEARRSPSQSRSRETVDRILEAAAQVFGELGYPAATTNRVAERAGVSIGSLYQYFPNKDALLVALEQRHLAEMGVALAAETRAWRRERPEPAAWAGRFVDALIELNDSPLHVVVYDTAPPLPAVEEETRLVVDLLITEVARLLRRWGHRRAARLRAEILVVTALRLVHDLAIRQPAGRARARCRDQIVELITPAPGPGPGPAPMTVRAEDRPGRPGGP